MDREREIIGRQTEWNERRKEGGREERRKKEGREDWNLTVYNRSACQPRETMVSVTAEHPSLRNHIMIPSCVALRRCTGCCSDDSLDCVPSRSREAILEVRGGREQIPPYFQVESHLGLNLLFPSLSSRSCVPCRDRKKQPDPQTCKCVCRHQSGHCERRGMKFSESTCR
uniref:Platelet-derived growth factor (PDGF) family profile domain-containing protein n=1 Tax=Pseudonaja textilis TaxID=8673 RepID=A0A670ZRB3_PSETE